MSEQITSPSDVNKLPTGVPFLDRLLNGGQVPGETYGLLGPIGVGKSTFAAMLAAEGALRLAQADGRSLGRRAWILVNLDGSASDPMERVISHGAKICRNRKLRGILSDLSSRNQLRAYEASRANELPQDAKGVLGERERWERVHPILKRHFDLLHLANDSPNLSVSPCTFIRHELDKLAASGSVPAGVIIDYGGALVGKYVEGREKQLSWELSRFVHEGRDLIAAHFDCPVWIVHQLAYKSGGKSPGVLHDHGDAADCPTFADDLTACLVLGTRDRLNGCLTIRCTKAGEQPPTIEPTILDIDPNFATLRERPEYELDSMRRIVRSDMNEIDVDPDVWKEIQKLPGR